MNAKERNALRRSIWKGALQAIEGRLGTVGGGEDDVWCDGDKEWEGVEVSDICAEVHRSLRKFIAKELVK